MRLPPLDSLVTPESASNWDMKQIGEAVADHAIASKVRYLDPHWAMILLPFYEGETYAVNREHRGNARGVHAVRRWSRRVACPRRRAAGLRADEL
jgi:hypothetical protein